MAGGEGRFEEHLLQPVDPRVEPEGSERGVSSPQEIVSIAPFRPDMACLERDGEVSEALEFPPDLVVADEFGDILDAPGASAESRREILRVLHVQQGGKRQLGMAVVAQASE